MKTFLTILVISFLSVSCNNQESNNKTLIDNFVRNIIISKENDFEKWKKYLDIQSNLSNDEMILENEIIYQHIVEINLELEKSDYNFDIVHFDELEKMSLGSNLKYDDYSKVYFIVVNNEIVTPIIVDNDKIISFFYGITKHREISVPTILNNKS